MEKLKINDFAVIETLDLSSSRPQSFSYLSMWRSFLFPTSTVGTLLEMTQKLVFTSKIYFWFFYIWPSEKPTYWIFPTRSSSLSWSDCTTSKLKRKTSNSNNGYWLPAVPVDRLTSCFSITLTTSGNLNLPTAALKTNKAKQPDILASHLHNANVNVTYFAHFKWRSSVTIERWRKLNIFKQVKQRQEKVFLYISLEEITRELYLNPNIWYHTCTLEENCHGKAASDCHSVVK